MLTNQELSQLLRVRGYKVTPQRLAIYAALAEKYWHPSAEELYQKMLPSYPNMSFATVYKTLEILQKLNLARMLSTGEDSFRFEADMSEHQHLQCTCCGAIKDIRVPNEEGLTASIEASSGYAIQKKEFYFFGLCPECRNK